ncbi:MAG: hypothetical protein ACRCX8_20140 [Sarcina sp.]
MNRVVVDELKLNKLGLYTFVFSTLITDNGMLSFYIEKWNKWDFSATYSGSTNAWNSQEFRELINNGLPHDKFNEEEMKFVNKYLDLLMLIVENLYDFPKV